MVGIKFEVGNNGSDGAEGAHDSCDASCDVEHV